MLWLISSDLDAYCSRKRNAAVLISHVQTWNCRRGHWRGAIAAADEAAATALHRLTAACRGPIATLFEGFRLHTRHGIMRLECHRVQASVMTSGNWMTNCAVDLRGVAVRRRLWGKRYTWLLREKNDFYQYRFQIFNIVLNFLDMEINDCKK